MKVAIVSPITGIWALYRVDSHATVSTARWMVRLLRRQFGKHFDIYRLAGLTMVEMLYNLLRMRRDFIEEKWNDHFKGTVNDGRWTYFDIPFEDGDELFNLDELLCRYRIVLIDQTP